MSRDAEQTQDFIIGINWGSSNFRAYRLTPNGQLVDEIAEPAGISGLGRAGMEALASRLAQRWPGALAVYAAGMIGSNIGWLEVPYAQAPSRLLDIASQLAHTQIGDLALAITPGICCSRVYDGGPDILRGEEIELFGFASMRPTWQGLAVLPGTHSKWVRFDEGRITDFFTSMSGEMFDKLTASGLLSSIIEGEAVDGDAFHAGVHEGNRRQLGLGTLLFGARARVIRGQLKRTDAASYLRGLLIGSEIADARAVHPDLSGTCVPLIGNSSVCRLYASALASLGVDSELIESKHTCIAGFSALHQLTVPGG